MIFSEVITLHLPTSISQFLDSGRKFWTLDSGRWTLGVCSSDKMTPIYFLRLSQVWGILHDESVGRVHKKCYLILLYTFFVCFSS